MGTITTGTGLISGLNTSDIIDQLMKIDGKQGDLYQAKVDDATAQKTAFLDLTTRLTGLQITSQQLSKPSFFSNATATSSNEDVLTATTSAGAAVGSYQFQVARLVQSEQLVSNGFSDYDSSPVGAGQITVEVGGGGVTQSNALADLRGGKGISRGQVRLTDRAGHSDVINLGDAITLDDVVKKINTSVNVSIKAAIQNNRLTLTDTSGGMTSNMMVQDVGDTTAAADLGIASTSVNTQIVGQPLMYVGRDTKLSGLNDGNGVQDSKGNDFSINVADGSTVGVDLAGATSVGAVLDAINTIGAGKVTASLTTDGTAVQLTDLTTGGTALAVTAVNGSTTAADLGLTGTAVGTTLTGTSVQAGLGTVLLKTLNGGAGVTLGTMSVTNRSGTATTVDLSQAKTLQDALDTINASGAGVTASVKASGNGIQLVDTTTGTGTLTIADTTGTGAAQLGIAGTFAVATPTVQGANLQRKWVSGGMSLDNYNGGKGVPAGEFSITDGSGRPFDVEIDEDDHTIGDVIAKINAAAMYKKKMPDGTTATIQPITASINAHGDGILLTDSSAAAGATAGVISVADKGGSTAKSLNLLGKGTGTTLDGSMEKTVAVTATDTLEAVQKKINDLSFGVTASVINDAAAAGPTAFRSMPITPVRPGR